MATQAFIAGVGMVPFVKPGANAPYPDMAAQATRLALTDAGVGYERVQQAYVGYVYGDSTAGQKALYGVGMTGIPIVNVNNNCSTGSTALFLARQAIESGAVDCVLALGFEQMNLGPSATCSPTGPARSRTSTAKPPRWWACPSCRWPCVTSGVRAKAICRNTAHR